MEKVLEKLDSIEKRLVSVENRLTVLENGTRDSNRSITTDIDYGNNPQNNFIRKEKVVFVFVNAEMVSFSKSHLISDLESILEASQFTPLVIDVNDINNSEYYSIMGKSREKVHGVIFISHIMERIDTELTKGPLGGIYIRMGELNETRVIVITLRISSTEPYPTQRLKFSSHPPLVWNYIRDRESKRFYAVSNDTSDINFTIISNIISSWKRPYLK